MKILTVTELTAAIKAVLEPNFRGISVKGEISNFKQQSSGHLYFSRKTQAPRFQPSCLEAAPPIYRECQKMAIR